MDSGSSSGHLTVMVELLGGSPVRNQGSAVIPAIEGVGGLDPLNWAIYNVGIYNPDCATLKVNLKVAVISFTLYSDHKFVINVVNAGNEAYGVAVDSVIA